MERKIDELVGRAYERLKAVHGSRMVNTMGGDKLFIELYREAVKEFDGLSVDEVKDICEEYYEDDDGRLRYIREVYKGSTQKLYVVAESMMARYLDERVELFGKDKRISKKHKIHLTYNNEYGTLVL